MSKADNYLIQYVLKLKDKFSPEFKRAVAAVKSNEAAIRQASKKTKDVVTSTAKSYSSSYSNASEKVGGALSSVTTKLGSFSKAIEKSGVITSYAARAALRFGPAIAAIGLAVTALMGIVKAYAAAWQEGKLFEQTMANLKAILDPTTTDFKALNAEARNLGENTKFTAVEVADSMTKLGKMGFDTNEILAATPAVLNLASATMEDMDVVATSTAATIRQFNLDAKDTGRVTDVMAKSFNQSSLDLAKFSDSMRYVGPTAKSVGLSVEETTGALAALANRAIHGSQAGTSLRRVLLKLSDEGSSVSKKLKSMGVDGAAPFIEKLKALKAAGMSVTELKKHFGILAVTTADVMIKSADSVEDYTKALQDAGGTADRMAKTQLDTLQGRLILMNSALTETKLTLFDTFSDEAKDSIDRITDGVKDLTSMIRDNKEDFKEFARTLISVAEAAMKAGGFLANMTAEGIRFSNEVMNRAVTFTKLTAGDLGLADGPGFSEYKESIGLLAIFGEKAQETRMKIMDADSAIYLASISINKLSDEIIALEKAGDTKGVAAKVMEVGMLEKQTDENLKVVKDYTVKLNALEISAQKSMDKILVASSHDPKVMEMLKAQKAIYTVPKSLGVQNAVDSSKLKPGFEGEVDPLLTGGGDSSEPDKERERALALAKSLSDQMVLIGTEGRVKEFEQAEIKYRNQFDLLDKFGIDTGNLSKLHREAIYSINEKWDKKDAESLAKAEKEKAARRKAFDDVALAASNEAYVNSLADDEARDMYKLELEMQRLNEAARLKFAKLDTARKNQVDLNNVYANIEANIDKKKTDIAIKYSEERIKQAEKESEMKLAAANQFFGGWGALTAEAAKRDKAYSKLAKTLLIMQATMNMFASASKSLAIYGYTPTGLAAASGAMAQGAANIAGISSQSFANGGIVQGNSYTGDNVKANVNSGEMILNQAQQRHLFAVANGRVNPVSSNVNNTSSTIGDIYINATPDTDTEKVKNAVLEAISESNISQARRERQNLEFGVTA